MKHNKKRKKRTKKYNAHISMTCDKTKKQSTLENQALIRSPMTYGATTWGKALKMHIKKLKRIQNSGLGRLTNELWYGRNH